jgi:DNA-binding NtrC family response regulator
VPTNDESSADAAEANVDARHAEALLKTGCGPELFGRLQIQAPALRVLYMSGYTEQSAARTAGLDRGLPFVQKPFTAAEFARQVRDALDR